MPRLHVILALALLAPAAAAALPPGLLPANPWLGTGTLNFAHQGGEIEAPSNTMFAFKTALAKGADVIELDVHATSDGEIVVLHDATVDRTTDGAGRVDAMTLSEIQQLDAAFWFVPNVGTTHSAPASAYALRGIATGAKAPPPGFAASDFRIPTLREVLATFPGVRTNIEIKNTAPDTTPYEATLASLLAEFERSGDVVVVSFHDQAMALFEAAAPDVSTAPAIAETAAFFATTAAEAPGAPIRHHAVQVPITYEGITVVTQDFVDDAHANGVAVHVWTINTRSEMEMLIDLGVDGIMTDRPTLLAQVLRERGA